MAASQRCAKLWITIRDELSGEASAEAERVFEDEGASFYFLFRRLAKRDAAAYSQYTNTSAYPAQFRGNNTYKYVPFYKWISIPGMSIRTQTSNKQSTNRNIQIWNFLTTVANTKYHFWALDIGGHVYTDKDMLDKS